MQEYLQADTNNHLTTRPPHLKLPEVYSLVKWHERAEWMTSREWVSLSSCMPPLQRTPNKIFKTILLSLAKFKIKQSFVFKLKGKYIYLQNFCIGQIENVSVNIFLDIFYSNSLICSLLNLYSSDNVNDCNFLI